MSTVDPSRAAYLRSRYDEARGMEHWTLSYVGAGGTYEVSAWSDGGGGHCTCPAYAHAQRRPRTCKHILAFGDLLDHVERGLQARRGTRELRLDEAWFARQATLTTDQRRVLNAIRAELRWRGVRPLGAGRGRAATDEVAGG